MPVSRTLPFRKRKRKGPAQDDSPFKHTHKLAVPILLFIEPFLHAKHQAQYSMWHFPMSAPLLEAWLLLFYVSSLVTSLWSFKVEKTPAGL